MLAEAFLDDPRREKRAGPAAQGLCFAKIDYELCEAFNSSGESHGRFSKLQTRQMDQTL